MARGCLVGQGSSRGLIRFRFDLGVWFYVLQKLPNIWPSFCGTWFPSFLVPSCLNASPPSPIHPHPPTSASLPWHFFLSSGVPHLSSSGEHYPARSLPPFMTFLSSPWLSFWGPLWSLPCIRPLLPCPPLHFVKTRVKSNFLLNLCGRLWWGKNHVDRPSWAPLGSHRRPAQSAVFTTLLESCSLFLSELPHLLSHVHTS